MASSNDVPAGKGNWRPYCGVFFQWERMSIGSLFPLSLSLGVVGSQNVVCYYTLLASVLWNSWLQEIVRFFESISIIFL